ncbi:vacuolar protein sorting-associated protein 52, partial [Phenoliferia sp. Uapishka_3]
MSSVAELIGLERSEQHYQISAAQKILAYFLSLLKPFTTAVTDSLGELQNEVLLPSKPLFDFLRRHAARQAHEFQKSYVSTIRWYYETGFRRYIRALEKMRIRGMEKNEPIGEVTLGSKNSLALLARKNSIVPGASSRTARVVPPTSLGFAGIPGPGIALAHMANDPTYRPSPEALFRSVAIVLMDSAETEYSFLSNFFGQHSTLSVTTPRPEAPAFFSPTPSEHPRDDADGGESVVESELGKTSMTGSLLSKEERGDILRKTVVEGLWKSVLEPAQEYSRNFISALLEPTSPPTPVSMLCMVRLHEAVVASLVDGGRCPPMESFLIGVRMALWPTFSKVMNVQIDSVRKINGAGTSVVGAFTKAIGATTVKDSAVQIIALRYTDLFNTFIALSGEQDEEMVFGSLLRLRNEVDRLLVTQAAKIPDRQKQQAFLSTHYEELLQGLSAGISTHPRCQMELSHFREIARKV